MYLTHNILKNIDSLRHLALLAFGIIRITVGLNTKVQPPSPQLFRSLVVHVHCILLAIRHVLRQRRTETPRPGRKEGRKEGSPRTDVDIIPAPSLAQLELFILPLSLSLSLIGRSESGG